MVVQPFVMGCFNKRPVNRVGMGLQAACMPEECWWNLEWFVLPNQGDEATFYPHCAVHCFIMRSIWLTRGLAFCFLWSELCCLRLLFVTALPRWFWAWV